MTFGDIAKRLGKLAVDNSPAILTAIGATGVLTTAYLAGSASFKAAEILKEEEERKAQLVPEDGPLDNREKFEAVWKLYIPAASCAVLTMSAIIMANRIGARRTAAFVSAYSLSEKAFDEYKKKVREKVGPKKEGEIRDEIAQDRISANPPPPTREIIIAGGGDVLCHDLRSGRYFKSDMETLKRAQNNVNYRVVNYSYASLSDFYDEIGLPRTEDSEEVGWTTDELLELLFSTALTEDGRPCIAFSFSMTKPIRGFDRL